MWKNIIVLSKTEHNEGHTQQRLMHKKESDKNGNTVYMIGCN